MITALEAVQAEFAKPYVGNGTIDCSYDSDCEGMPFEWAHWHAKRALKALGIDPNTPINQVVASDLEARVTDLDQWQAAVREWGSDEGDGLVATLNHNFNWLLKRVEDLERRAK